MKNKIIPIQNIDVHGQFLSDINLWKIVGNQHTVAKLQILVNEYLNNQVEGRNAKPKNILLAGPNNAGKTVLAHAYSNSLGCLNCYEADGATLSTGGECIYRFLNQGDNNSAFLIHHCEKLTAYCVHAINMVLQTHTLHYYDILETMEKQYDFNQLLILTCSSISKINSQILKNIDEWFNVNNVFLPEEIHKILLQRITYLKWEVDEQDKFIKSIVDVVGGEVSKAINLLGWAHSCARATGVDLITVKHLNKALHIL